MEIIINAEAKEIAALVEALQGRREVETLIFRSNPSKLASLLAEGKQPPPSPGSEL